MSQLDSIQQMNVQIASLTQLRNELRAICPSDDTAVVQVPQDVQGELQAAGIAVVTTQAITGKDIKQWIEQIQGQIDSLNSSQQLNMINLQNQLNKQNEANQILSDQVKKMQNTTNAVINNMR